MASEPKLQHRERTMYPEHCLHCDRQNSSEVGNSKPWISYPIPVKDNARNNEDESQHNEHNIPDMDDGDDVSQEEVVHID
jgi:hypothetical protein